MILHHEDTILQLMSLVGFITGIILIIFTWFKSTIKQFRNFMKSKRINK